MAHKHTVLERFPCEVLWRLKMAMKEEITILIDDISVAIEHRWAFLAVASLSSQCHQLQRIGSGETVTAFRNTM